jgi:mRNA interferase RelE/StbE
MALYKVVLSKQVRKKDLQKIPAKTLQRIVDLISGLQTNPRPRTVTKLTNREEYRMRSGNYRILYIIDDVKKQVEIRKISHRGGVYK